MRKLGFLFFLLLIVSCNKQDDLKDPEIEFITPAENELFDFSGYIDFLARISDNRQVETVRIGLVNMDLIAITQPVFIQINKQDTLLQYKLLFTATDFDIGQNQVMECMIHIQVSDGTNMKNKYRKIRLKFSQNVNFEFIYTVKDNHNTVFWSYNPKTLVNEPIHSFPYETAFLEGQFSGPEYFFYADNPPQLQAWSRKMDAPLWVKDVPFPSPQLRDVYLKEDDLLYGDENGHITLIHAKTGNTLLTSSFASQYLLIAVSFDPTYLYAALKNLQTQKTELQLFYRASGVFYKKFFLDAGCLDMDYCSATQQLVLFDVSGENTVLSFFQPTTELFLTPTTIPALLMKHMKPLGSSRYLLGDFTQLILLDMLTLEKSTIYTGTQIQAIMVVNDAKNDVAILDDNRLFFEDKYISLNGQIQSITLIGSTND